MELKREKEARAPSPASGARLEEEAPHQNRRRCRYLLQVRQGGRLRGALPQQEGARLREVLAEAQDVGLSVDECGVRNPRGLCRGPGPLE